MNIEIRKLTPNLLEDYMYFFENVAHEDCYCTCYCSDNQVGMDFQLQEVRRDYAISYIKEGKIKGYLAYRDNQVVAWCNVNDKSDCLECEGWQRILTSVKTTDSTANIKVKSIFCFVVAPDMRRTGVASYLLEHVCKDAVEDGFDYIEAYPNKDFIDIYYDHMGPVNLYIKFGFEEFYKTEQKIVMRKRLK